MLYQRHCNPGNAPDWPRPSQDRDKLHNTATHNNDSNIQWHESLSAPNNPTYTPPIVTSPFHAHNLPFAPPSNNITNTYPTSTPAYHRQGPAYGTDIKTPPRPINDLTTMVPNMTSRAKEFQYLMAHSYTISDYCHDIAMFYHLTHCFTTPPSDIDRANSVYGTQYVSSLESQARHLLNTSVDQHAKQYAELLNLDHREFAFDKKEKLALTYGQSSTDAGILSHNPAYNIPIASCMDLHYPTWTEVVQHFKKTNKDKPSPTADPKSPRQIHLSSTTPGTKISSHLASITVGTVTPIPTLQPNYFIVDTATAIPDHQLYLLDATLENAPAHQVEYSILSLPPTELLGATSLHTWHQPPGHTRIYMRFVRREQDPTPIISLPHRPIYPCGRADLQGRYRFCKSRQTRAPLH
eukprot:Ihof_evm7s234 gene=Ihof_evmTU7s234